MSRQRDDQGVMAAGCLFVLAWLAVSVTVIGVGAWAAITLVNWLVTK